MLHINIMYRELAFIYFLQFPHADNRKHISVNNSTYGKCIDGSVCYNLVVEI